MKKKISFLLAAFFALPAFVSAEVLSVELDPSGVLTDVVIPAGYSDGKIVAYYVSRGNESAIGDFVVNAPAGVTVTAKASLGTADALSMLATTTNWYPVKFLGAKGKEIASLSVAGSTTPSQTTPSTPATPTGDYYCSVFTLKEIDEIIKLLKQYTGHSYTRDEICALYAGYGGGTPGDDWNSPGGENPGDFYEPSTGTSSPFVLHKDTCSVPKKGSVLVQFEVSFAGLSAELMANGFTMQAGVYQKPYSGAKRAALKPRSEGRYSPQPIFLMVTVGGYEEEINALRWKNGQIDKMVTTNIGDYTYWKGDVLTRTPASKAMKLKGKATVEATNGYQMYSVCFQMKKKRQNLNGYKQ